MSSQQRRNQQETVQAGTVVELSRTSGDELFICSLADWNFIRDLGRTFGWHPAGTTYLPQQGERARLNPIKHDYHPGDSQDSKRVEVDDCAQWVAALDRARRSPFIAGMLRTHAQLQGASGTLAEQSLYAQLQSFSEFARRGAFTIAFRDSQ
ncbi:hypothetical protein [Peristeroidobacter agariperforans]|uniref:hypothetical protein n=1 Tax=Peristeroidobacter agariperforans TaxID=268404 RepID=UPI00101BC989|nr:hypothetical protein [Peristeroidobacter agariperforans]